MTDIAIKEEICKALNEEGKADIDQLMNIVEKIQRGHQNHHLPKKYLNVDEAAQYLGLSKSTIYQYTAAGKIMCHRSSGKLYFEVRHLDTYVEGTSLKDEMAN